MNNTRRRGLVAAAVLSTLPWFAPLAHAAPVIADQALRYAVSYGNRSAGEITVTIRNEDDGYVVASTATPSALASLFVKAHASDTRFVRRGGDVVLDRGYEDIGGERRNFYFDHGRRRIVFGDGDTYAVHPGDAFEAVAFPLLLMLRPRETIAGLRVREVSFKRVRDYTYARPAEEVVRVPAGEFVGWKIRRHRSDRPADSVTVWLAKADDAATPVPVKIVIRKRGGVSTLVLTTLTGAD